MIETTHILDPVATRVAAAPALLAGSGMTNVVSVILDAFAGAPER